MTRYSQTMKEVLMEVRGLLDENAFKKLQFVAKDLAKLAAKDKKGMDYKDYMKAAAMMKTGKVKELRKFVNDLDTAPREVIIMKVAREMGNATAERIFEATAFPPTFPDIPCPECKKNECTCIVKEAFASRRPGNQMSDLYKLYTLAMKTMPGSPKQKEIEKKITALRKELKLDEKLGKDADAGDYIDDFKKSDAPQFKGKSDKKKKDMAIAAYLDAKDKKEEVELDEDADKSLKKKADASGISLSILKKVFDRGVAAWKGGHRPGTTPVQWAHARVNSFISGGKTRTTGDADLWKQHKGKSEEVEEETIDELKMNDPKLNKIFDKLKRGDTVKLKTSSTISKGTDFVDYVVKAKNTVNKGRVEKVTLVTKGNEKAVKKFLYKRDGKVTFAIGDMGASIDDIKEELDEGMKYTHVAVDKKGLVIGFASDEKDAKDMARRNDGKVVKLKKPMSDKKGDMMVNRPFKEEDEKKMDKPDSAKAVDQARDDKKKTRIAQLQLQIAKATETINKLNTQEKPDA